MEHSKDDLTKIVLNVIHAETNYPESSIGLKKSLADELDIDSISIMTILINTQEQTKIEIPDEDWASLTTVELLVDYLLTKQKGE
jgi:acyl carrier protein